MSGNREVNDAAFEGLYAASGVSLSEQEKAQLRQAYDIMQTFCQRVRKPGVTWEAKPLLGYVPSRKGLKA